MRVKLDENLGQRSVVAFASAGHDVETVHAEHMSGASDDEVLRAAVDEGRALVTLDADFANPFRFPPSQTVGIAVLRVRDMPGRNDLDLVVNQLIDGLARADLTGALWVVEPARIRRYVPYEE